jgi:hypothetical protein
VVKYSGREEEEEGMEDGGREEEGTEGGVEERKGEDISYREKRRMEVIEG